MGKKRRSTATDSKHTICHKLKPHSQMKELHITKCVTGDSNKNRIKEVFSYFLQIVLSRLIN